MGGERDGGKGHNGGVWEWTSSVFDKYDGFISSKLYPGYACTMLTLAIPFPDITFSYSMDFFDGYHHTVVSS
jgi:hypothetical protein